MRRALERRATLSVAGTNTYRLVNAAGDGLPGLTVDRFAEVVVVSSYEPGAEIGPVLEALRDQCPELRSAYVKERPREAGKLAEQTRAELAPATPAFGPPAERVVAIEDGVRYEIRPAAGLSVGLFLDMREVRSWLRTHATGLSVLNLFAYTCAFGVCASLGGAERVLNVDASRSYLAWGQENYRLNGLLPDTRDFVHGDAFDWLRRLRKRPTRFDLVIVDPPSFSRTRQTRFAAERDYARLVSEAAALVASRGILLAATNHAGLSHARFRSLVARGLAESGRQGSVVGRWHEPTIDFPVAPGQEPYLKVAALRLDATEG